MLSPDVTRLKKIYDSQHRGFLELGREGQWVVMTDAGVVGWGRTYGDALIVVQERVPAGSPYLLHEVMSHDRALSSIRRFT